MTLHFRDRRQAGAQLGSALKAYWGNPEVIVYALPRGGVETGRAVAGALEAPLSLVIARKIGHPAHEEYAIGAVTEEGEPVFDDDGRQYFDEAWLAPAIARAREEAHRRREAYFGERTALPATRKIAIVVDDGVATGLTLRAAIAALRAEQPQKIVVAVPMAPPEVAQTLEREAAEVVILERGAPYLGAVGAYYDDFPQLADDDVRRLLAVANR